MAASLLSVNGKLRPLFFDATEEPARASGYTAITIGKPLMVRYLRFSLQFEKAESQNEVMISTFVKATESKQAAAEAINFFDPKVRLGADKHLSIDDFGGENYGHPLCYYNDSYLGESLYLTTKIMELDKVDPAVVKAIQRGIGTVSSLPMFAQFLPYLAGAGVGVGLFEKLVNLFNKDDAVIDGHDLDLHFDLNNARRLQSGRIVCIPGAEADVFLQDGKFRLRSDNRLVDSASGQEYTGGSYVVIQVDAKRNTKFKDFDYFVGASDLLAQTNRRAGGRDTVETFVELARGANDLVAIREIEALSFDAADDPQAKARIKALHKSMSPDIRKLHEARVREVVG